MNEKEKFGQLTSEEFSVGDIVQWTTWDKHSEQWNTNYGVLIKLENMIKSDRMVSIATVKPLNEQFEEKELFTLNLKLVKSGEFDKTSNSHLMNSSVALSIRTVLGNCFQQKISRLQARKIEPFGSRGLTPNTSMSAVPN